MSRIEGDLEKHQSNLEVTREWKFEFHGQTSEFFRIWIVQTALTLFTLGIYSAWAKVRVNRYLLANTSLDDSRFDYHADPVKILKGRTFILIFIGIAVVERYLFPSLNNTINSIFILLFPWFIVRSQVFSLKNISFRGLRFGFLADYTGAYISYAKGFFISLITFGIGFFYTDYLDKKFRMGHTQFGSSYFDQRATPRQFLHLYLQAAAIYFIVLVTAVVGLGIALKPIQFRNVTMNVVKGIVPFVVLIPFVLSYFWVRAARFRILMNSSQLGGLALYSSVKIFELTWILFSGALASILTFGLAYPWAKLRTLRYKTKHSGLRGDLGALQRFNAALSRNSGENAATGTDFLDIDVGF